MACGIEDTDVLSLHTQNLLDLEVTR